MATIESTYKGHPTLNCDGVVTLGLRKLGAILDNIDAVKAFVEKHRAARAALAADRAATHQKREQARAAHDARVRAREFDTLEEERAGLGTQLRRGGTR